jgi:hypothetical protein
VRITRQAVTRSCAICGRTLLLGERTTRYTPNSGEGYVDVCPLCHEIATEHGWLKEGSPTTPTVSDQRRRRRGLSSLFERPAPPAPVASDPILRRLSEPELAVVEAADLFNGSQFRRQVGGIAKSLGEPKASIIPLGGVNRELVITIAWDISWYQYRVALDSAQPVRLADRGLEIEELEGSATSWNARVEPDGRIVPQIARL